MWNWTSVKSWLQWKFRLCKKREYRHRTVSAWDFLIGNVSITRNEKFWKSDVSNTKSEKKKAPLQLIESQHKRGFFALSSRLCDQLKNYGCGDVMGPMWYLPSCASHLFRCYFKSDNNRIRLLPALRFLPRLLSKQSWLNWLLTYRVKVLKD